MVVDVGAFVNLGDQPLPDDVWWNLTSLDPYVVGVWNDIAAQLLLGEGNEQLTLDMTEIDVETWVEIEVRVFSQYWSNSSSTFFIRRTVETMPPVCITGCTGDASYAGAVYDLAVELPEW